MTLSRTTQSLITISIMTLMVLALRRTTLSIMTFSFMALNMPH
jgi:hypothetical protein